MLGGAIPRIKEALAHRGEDSLELCWRAAVLQSPSWVPGQLGHVVPFCPALLGLGALSYSHLSSLLSPRVWQWLAPAIVGPRRPQIRPRLPLQPLLLPPHVLLTPALPCLRYIRLLPPWRLLPLPRALSSFTWLTCLHCRVPV